MSILENRPEWEDGYRSGWLTHLKKTGQTYWELYARPRNRTPVPGPAIDLASSRLMLISSAGGYLRGEQEPFAATNLLGDYTIRVFATNTPFERIAYAHDHYDHAAVDSDPQVLLPLEHLRQMNAQGEIGDLTQTVSFMGYLPDISRLLDETIPAILKVAHAEKAQGALLVPA